MSILSRRFCLRKEHLRNRGRKSKSIFSRKWLILCPVWSPQRYLDL